MAKFSNYWVRAQVNLCAENIQLVHVRAKTEDKAKTIAKKMLEKAGYKYIQIISCKSEGAYSFIDLLCDNDRQEV